MSGYSVRRKLGPFDWAAKNVTLDAARKAAAAESEALPGSVVLILDAKGELVQEYLRGKPL